MLHVPITTPALLYKNERARKPIKGGLTKRVITFSAGDKIKDWMDGWTTFRFNNEVLSVPTRTLYEDNNHGQALLKPN